ncbi:hypothetical protein MKEN_00917500 [Mycena kentingensis (nom. inval.)]|nr:hypothetical protein MKEN_00917500 [Mycena kentingensis (nom. inval.)]
MTSTEFTSKSDFVAAFVAHITLCLSEREDLCQDLLDDQSSLTDPLQALATHIVVHSNEPVLRFLQNLSTYLRQHHDLGPLLGSEDEDLGAQLRLLSEQHAQAAVGGSRLGGPTGLVSENAGAAANRNECAGAAANRNECAGAAPITMDFGDDGVPNAVDFGDIYNTEEELDFQKAVPEFDPISHSSLPRPNRQRHTNLLPSLALPSSSDRESEDEIPGDSGRRSNLDNSVYLDAAEKQDWEEAEDEFEEAEEQRAESTFRLEVQDTLGSMFGVLTHTHELNHRVDHKTGPTAREPRLAEVEIAKNMDTSLAEVCLAPPMVRVLAKCALSRPEDRERILDNKLTREQHTQLTAGIRVVRGCLSQFREADNQIRHVCAEGNIAVEAVNILNGCEDSKNPKRVFLHAGAVGKVKGTACLVIPDCELEGLINGESKPLVVDEVKTEESVGQPTIPKFMGMSKARLDDHLRSKPCVIVHFDSPTDHVFADEQPEPGKHQRDAQKRHKNEEDTTFQADPPPVRRIDKYTQAILQLWCQMQVKNVPLGIISSHAFTIIAICDPQMPNRLYVSLCMQTFKTAEKGKDSNASAAEGSQGPLGESAEHAPADAPQSSPTTLGAAAQGSIDPLQNDPDLLKDDAINNYCDVGVWALFCALLLVSRPDQWEEFMEEFRKEVAAKAVYVHYADPGHDGNAPGAQRPTEYEERANNGYGVRYGKPEPAARTRGQVAAKAGLPAQTINYVEASRSYDESREAHDEVDHEEERDGAEGSSSKNEGTAEATDEAKVLDEAKVKATATAKGKGKAKATTEELEETLVAETKGDGNADAAQPAAEDPTAKGRPDKRTRGTKRKHEDEDDDAEDAGTNVAEPGASEPAANEAGPSRPRGNARGSKRCKRDGIEATAAPDTNEAGPSGQNNGGASTANQAGPSTRLPAQEPRRNESRAAKKKANYRESPQKTQTTRKKRTTKK